MTAHARQWFPLLAASLLLALWATRLYQLESFPPFLDEAIHIFIAEKAVTTGPLAEAQEGRLFAIWWYVPFQPGAGSPLWIVRAATILAVLPGAAALIAFARWIAGWQGGLLAGLLYLFSPYHLFFDRLALSDPIAASATLVALFWAFSRRSAGLTAAALFAAVGAKIAALPYLFIPVAAALSHRAWRWMILTLAISLGLVGLFILVLDWRGYNVLMLFATHNPSLLQSLTVNLPRNIVQTFIALSEYNGPLLLLFLLAGLVIRRSHLSLSLLLVLLLPLLPIWMNQRQSGRYYIVPVSILLLCAAAGWGRWLRADSLPRLGLVVAAVLIAVLQWWPFATALYHDPAALPLSANDRAEYIASDASGFGLAALVEALEARPVDEVIGLLSNCLGLRYVAHFPVTCPHLALDGSSVPALTALIEDSRKPGVFAVLENNAYVPESLPGTPRLTVERPGSGSYLTLYDLAVE